MIQKGIVTQEEAVKVRAEADALRAKTPSGSASTSSKWKINDAIQQLELFGDVRMRFEDRLAQDPRDAEIRLQRERYALRLGLRGDVYDNFYFGLRLETGANGRSPWVTMGTAASASSGYQGPFGKSNSGINLGQAYLGGRAGDWLDITAGKMPNPLFTTPMVWDSDLSPEGLAERFKHTVGSADFFATFGQFLYEDANPSQTSGGFFGIGNNNNVNNNYPGAAGGSSTPAFLLAWQAGVNYHFTTNISFKAAPVLYNYAGQGANTTVSAGGQASPGFNNVFVGQGATNGTYGSTYGWSGYPSGNSDGFNANQTGINNLMVLELPWAFNFKLAKLNARVFGDYAQNLEGSDRAKAAYTVANHPPSNVAITGIRGISSPQTQDIHAYQVGFALGNGDLGLVYGTTSKKRAWEARVYWQHIEQYALDPNLLDSDFFEGRGNLEGIFTALAYGFTDNVIGTVRYGYANQINKLLGTGGSNQDIPQINPIARFQLIQMDLTLRF